MSAEGVMSGGQAEIHKGENARMSSFVGAIAIADLVKTTLGPKGKKRTIVINWWKVARFTHIHHLMHSLTLYCIC